MFYSTQIKVEATADISLEDDRSVNVSATEDKSNSISEVDEIDLNSDGDEFMDRRLGANAAKLEINRSEPEDIFEDIPEPKEFKTEEAAAPQPAFEPPVTLQPKVQHVCSFQIQNHIMLNLENFTNINFLECCFLPWRSCYRGKETTRTE